MKAFLLYIAAGAVIINIVGNTFANSAEGIKAARINRAERLCEINRDYCL